MTTIFEMEKKIKEIINDLKALMQQVGLSNSADEERVISSIFLYKFLNDKFMYNIQKFASDIDLSVEKSF
ncbi:hypothetical protein RCO48_32015 [Peribacillus frigoritolerans]|nr:hypothetical protein [Peribacillus frigoritolerans]